MILGKMVYSALGLFAALPVLVAPTGFAQSPPTKQPATSGGTEKTNSSSPSPVPTGAAEQLSDAERIARLQRSLKEAQKQIDEMRAKVDDPQGEYKKAEVEFTDLDRKHEEQRKNLQKLKEEGDGRKVVLAESELADLEKRRVLARERFDLAIKGRKGLVEQITTLEQKQQQDQDALNKLKGIPESKPAAAGTGDANGVPSQTGGPSVSTSTGAPPSGAAAQPSASTPGGSAPPAAPTTDAATQAPAAPSSGTVSAGLTGQPSGETGTVAPDAAKGPPSEKLVKAQEDASTKQAAAEEAKQQAQSVTERLESIRKAIANERDLRKTTKQMEGNARETLRTLNAELEKKWGEGSTWAQLKDLRLKIADAEKRVAEAETEIRERSDRIDAHQSELTALQTELIAAMKEAEQKALDARTAQEKVKQLKNPFTPQNILQWLIDHGPRIVLTLFGTIILLWLSKVLEHRLILLVARHGAAGTFEDRENRARTLVGVLRNATTVILVTGASLSIIAEFGVNIYPLVGAAGVVGLAVAFGAQNLIRDYFSGFMILMENQYTVNDVVRIGDTYGQVERITLRITVLRDLKGTVHFVPHGQINTVSNLTHGWSRAFFDIGVAYKEDVDRVMKVLVDLGKEMRRDPAYRDLILDELEMMGVDSFGDSSIVIRFLIKTRPLKQWLVKRELNRRIKKKFDELGIEIPFPQRVVYQHQVTKVEAKTAERDEVVDWPAPQPSHRPG